MPIIAPGWELRVERLGVQARGQLQRSYGRYRVYRDGVPVGLEGFMVEAIGPGDNSAPDNGRRIAAGRYRLTTHYRAFVSAGYAPSESGIAAPPMPGIRLLDTDRRSGILIHPVYPPAAKLYVASIGCLNPTAAVGAADNVDFWDSRARVIALLDSLRAFRPEAFAAPVPTPIDGAAVVIDGEPMHHLPG